MRLFLPSWPILLLGIDLAWFLLVGIFGVMCRIVLRRPWRVEATSETERREWFVQGFRAPDRARDELARQSEHGVDPASGAATLTG